MSEPRDLVAYRIGEDGIHGEVVVKDDLEALQEAVGGYIDIVRRRIGLEARAYTIVCDDEGLMKGRGITAIKGYAIDLVGTLLVLRDGGHGELASLSEADVGYVKSSMMGLVYGNSGDYRDVLGVV